MFPVCNEIFEFPPLRSAAFVRKSIIRAALDAGYPVYVILELQGSRTLSDKPALENPHFAVTLKECDCANAFSGNQLNYLLSKAKNLLCLDIDSLQFALMCIISQTAEL